MLCTVIVITGSCDLVKAVVDVINDSSEVANYQIISPIVLLLSAVSAVCMCMFASIRTYMMALTPYIIWMNVAIMDSQTHAHIPRPDP